MTLFLKNKDFIHYNATMSLDQVKEGKASVPISPAKMPDFLVACFAMGHVLVWSIVGIFDRSVYILLFAQNHTGSVIQRCINRSIN